MFSFADLAVAYDYLVCLVLLVYCVEDEDTSDENSLASSIVIPKAVLCVILCLGEKSVGRFDFMAFISDDPC